MEAQLLERKSIGIELNPLAILISKVKTTQIDLNNLPEIYNNLYNNLYNDNLVYEIIDFKNIDFWFDKSSKKLLSKLLFAINKIGDRNIRDFFSVCFSEIVREVSTCRHQGFKMHRDSDKINKEWTIDQVHTMFFKVFKKNVQGLVEYQIATSNKYNDAIIICGDARLNQKEIKKGSIDLILTSPPYGDSHTTVAYGQFSRLSSQWLNLKNENIKNIVGLDNELLGGRTIDKDKELEILNKSHTLRGAKEIFDKRMENLTDDDLVKMGKRYREVISFYYDLELSLKNGAEYLKQNKFFVLVTGSRVVKDIKLNTDIIIGEMGESLGLELQGILYRNIINKRMPNRVSSTNIIGEISPTMTKESIIILKKIG